jgi:hypothetical protein
MFGHDFEFGGLGITDGVSTFDEPLPDVSVVFSGVVTGLEDWEQPPMSAARKAIRTKRTR